MIHDFYAEFWDEHKKGANFDRVDKIDDAYHKIKLASLSMITESGKKWARENKYKYWVRTEYLGLIKSRVALIKELGINDPQNPPNLPYSVLIKIKFRLRKPYISKDDEEFYITENPICKDKFFKIPIIRSSSWKGALRWVALNTLLSKLPSDKYMAFGERAKLIRLFGNEKDKIEQFLDDIFNEKYSSDNPRKTVSQEFFEYILNKKYVNKGGNGRGRLIFYSTFFSGIGLDIIAPHKRKTKTVKVPIMFEVVPVIPASKGTFILLYIPFDILHSKERLEEEVPKDLELLKETIPKMLLEYGFSAKKTSGYGVVEDEIEFWINDNHYKGTFKEFKEKMNELINKIGD
ncbi:MAG: CRISPR-Cas system type III CSM-effector complex subunit Csm3 [Candidatus Alkanophagales archaeon MCA70_species_1]|nr:CRISPR-Cas system type III CSM-effector complex subunit Csm3 [Candidatus Alkanophaga volatiphilum]